MRALLIIVAQIFQGIWSKDEADAKQSKQK